MERTADNIGVLRRRLVGLGFCFASAPVAAEHVAAFDALVKKVGAVPPTLEALFAVVGDVSFRGWLPSWGSACEWESQLVDPFEFVPDVYGEIDRVEDELVTEELRAFRLPIAGDYLHKNDISGGAPTEVPLPSHEADARVVEDDGEWFRQYMRVASEHGLGSAAMRGDTARRRKTGLASRLSPNVFRRGRLPPHRRNGVVSRRDRAPLGGRAARDLIPVVAPTPMR